MLTGSHSWGSSFGDAVRRPVWLLALPLLLLFGCSDSSTPVDRGHDSLGGVIGTATLEGVPAAGMTVRIATEPERTTVTASDGGFRFGEVEEGVYRVELEGESPDGAFSVASRTVTVAAGSEVAVEFSGTLYRESLIEGTIKVGGEPLAGSGARLEGPESRAAQVDAEGRFSFGGLPRGEYTVEIVDVDFFFHDFPQTDESVLLATRDSVAVSFGGSRIPRPPAVPTGLGAEALTPSTVVVSWGAAERTDAYVLERSEEGGAWREIASPDSSVLEHEDVGLSPTTTYTYQIRACNDDGCSGHSDATEVTTPDTPPATPSSPLAEALGPHSIRVEWAIESDNETHFRVRRAVSGSWTFAGEVDAGETVFVDEDLEPATLYGYQVQACNDGGCSEFTSTAQVATRDVPPGAPADVAAVAVSGEHVRVTWSEASGNVDEYVIERRQGSGAWTDVGERDGTIRSFDDHSALPMTAYGYRVRACNVEGCSEPSSVASVETPQAPPAIPVSVSASEQGSSAIRVSWSSGGGEVESYEVRRSQGAAWTVLGEFSPSETELVDEDRQPASTYFYQVRACNEGGCSAYSESASATTRDIPPETPQSVDAEAESAYEVSVSWTSGGGNVGEFRVHRREGSGSWSVIATPSGSSSSYSDGSVDPDTEYSYRIQACNPEGCSSHSAVATVVTPDAPPSAPGNLSGTVVGTDQVELSWSLSSDNETAVELHRRTGSGSWGLLVSLDPGVEAYADEGLTSETSYSYRVRACGSAGCSSFSSEITVTTGVPTPSTPGGLDAVAASHSQVDLHWDAVSEHADEYEIERQVSGGSWSDLAMVQHATTSYTDGSVTGDESYGYRVRACGPGGCSSFSSAVQVTTPPAPVETFNMTIAGVHVNQVIQSFGGDVPLVAGRSGLLRVFVEANESNSAQPEVEVRIYHGTNLAHTQVIPAPAASVPTTAGGGAEDVAWEWVVPSSLVTPNMGIAVSVDPDDHISETDTSDNVYPASGGLAALDVWDTPPLDVRIVPIHQDSTGLTGEYFSSLMNDTRAMLPLDEVIEDLASVYTTSVPPLQSDNANGAWSDLISEINTLRNVEATGQHYYGLVRTTYTSGIAGLGYIGHPVSLGWDRTASAGWIAAHELGHNFGRRHAPCGVSGFTDPAYPHAHASTGEVAYRNGDLVDPVFAPPSEEVGLRDIMSYCGPRWISDYNFEAILNYRGTGSMVLAQSQVRAPALMLWGSVSPERGVVLQPSFAVETLPALPEAPGPYRLEGLAPDGRVLFDLSFEPYETGEEDGTSGFSFALPLSSFAAEELQAVRVLEDGREVARQEARTWSMDASAALQQASVSMVRGPQGQARIEWDSERHPLLVVRDPGSGRVLSLARGGVVTLPYAPPEGVEAIVSDGVRSLSEMQRHE